MVELPQVWSDDTFQDLPEEEQGRVEEQAARITQFIRFAANRQRFLNLRRNATPTFRSHVSRQYAQSPTMSQCPVTMRKTALVVAQDATLTIISKQDRPVKNTKDYTDLMSKATKPDIKLKFDELTVSITDPSKLEDTHRIQESVVRLREHCQFYDMYDCFIVTTQAQDYFGASPPSTLPTEWHNLFDSYNVLDPEQVASSNKWY